MKKQLLIILMMMMPMVAWADAVEIDGIYYDLSEESNSAGVTGSVNDVCVIPDSITYNGKKYVVTSIKQNAFFMNYELTSISIPPSIKSIGDCAFFDCTSINAVYISDLVAWCNIDFGQMGNSNPLGLAHHLYLNGEEMKNLVIPDSITEIKDRVFHGCEGLTSVVFHDKITSIGDQTFIYCSGLDSIQFPNSLLTIGESAFEGCSNIQSVVIPNRVRTIGSSAFERCKGLINLEILNSNMNETLFVENRAFANCPSLTTISFGPGYTSISSRSFAWCPSLADVYCYSEAAPSIYNNSFDGSNVENAILHVPANSVYDYQLSSPWKDFGKIVTIDTPGLRKCATPSVYYKNGILSFSSETEDVDFLYEISNADIQKGYGAEINLSVTYNISVYATKVGYENSDIATATLCWIDASPKTEGITNGVAQIAACPVLIKTDSGFIRVEGIEDRTDVSVYTTDGKLAGTTISHGNIATIATSFNPGSIAIVKVGKKSIKVVMK